jgi:hypothetical protein
MAILPKTAVCLHDESDLSEASDAQNAKAGTRAIVGGCGKANLQKDTACRN